MLAGLLEAYSVHILAQGIVAAGQAAMERMEVHDLPEIRNVHESVGDGVSGEVNGLHVRVGRLGFVLDTGQGDVASDKATESGATADSGHQESAVGHEDALNAFGESTFKPDEMKAFVSIDGKLASRLVLEDVPRPNAAASISHLRELGINEITMLTGDASAAAQIIAREVGIDDVRAGLLPQDKVEAVRSVPSKGTSGKGHAQTTMMVGDGVNDAPVLAAADIGIAMTDGTSTAASQSAQLVIMNDDISAVPDSVVIGRRTMRIMLESVIGGLSLAIVFMIVASFGLIPAIVGAFMQEGIDVVSILWALTALIDRRQDQKVPGVTAPKTPGQHGVSNMPKTPEPSGVSGVPKKPSPHVPSMPKAPELGETPQAPMPSDSGHHPTSS